jgi:hypothetical protein
MSAWLIVAAWLAVELVAWAVIHRDIRQQVAARPAKLPEARPRAVKGESAANNDLRIVAVITGEERYIFLFTDTPADRQTIVETADRFAADPDLSFTEAAAAAVAHVERSGRELLGSSHGPRLRGMSSAKSATRRPRQERVDLHDSAVRAPG